MTLELGPPISIISQDQGHLIDGKVFCWDMDETVGSFRRIWYRHYGLTPHLTVPAIRFRPEISNLLESINGCGGTNVLTTSGSAGYVEEVIKETGLDQYFQLIFTKKDIFTGNAKLYGPVANKLNIPETQVTDRMVVIGDSDFDQPADIGGLVFIHQPQAHLQSAFITMEVVQLLLERGKGRFGKGFQQLAEDRRLYSLSEGTIIQLEKRPISGNKEKFTPTIFVARHANLSNTEGRFLYGNS